MKRRQFIAMFGGAAAWSWVIDVRAQQPAKTVRIGFLITGNIKETQVD